MTIILNTLGWRQGLSYWGGFGTVQRKAADRTSLVDDYVRHGARSARIEVRPGDNLSSDGDGDERAEIARSIT
jgi:hypothetical protein